MSSSITLSPAPSHKQRCSCLWRHDILTGITDIPLWRPFRFGRQIISRILRTVPNDLIHYRTVTATLKRPHPRQRYPHPVSPTSVFFLVNPIFLSLHNFSTVALKRAFWGAEEEQYSRWWRWWCCCFFYHGTYFVTIHTSKSQLFGLGMINATYNYTLWHRPTLRGNLHRLYTPCTNVPIEMYEECW
jgi:hypothetical protein